MCCMFPTRRYKPSERQADHNNPTQATAGSSTLKRQPSCLVKLNPLNSTRPVQTRSAAIPLPPKYQSRGSNTPRVQDVTDPAIRISLFGSPTQINDHHQHHSSESDGRRNIIHHNSGCVGVRGSTRCGNDDSVDSVHPSSANSAKDDFASGGDNDSSHGGHDASGYAGAYGNGFIGGHT